MIAKIKEILIRCKICGKWFSSPITFGNSDSFDTSMLIGNQARCRNCGKMTGCDKKNIRVRYEGDDGGFLGIGT